jgi:hypothetical protein
MRSRLRFRSICHLPVTAAWAAALVSGCWASGCASSGDGGFGDAGPPRETGAEDATQGGDVSLAQDGGGGKDAGTDRTTSNPDSAAMDGTANDSAPSGDSSLDSGDSGSESGAVGDSSASDSGPEDGGGSGDAHDADSGTDAASDATPDTGGSCSGPGDCPPTGSACEVATCTSGVCGTTPAAAGTSCGTGGLVCDDAGTCTSTVVVVRVGDGSAALSSVATAVYLETRFVSDGTLAPMADNPLPLPTSTSGSNARLTLAGSATSEGALTLSADGHYVAIAGYDAAPGTALVASTLSAATNRIVGRIDAIGDVDTSTRINALVSGNNVRSAVTNDGTSFWVGGATNGVVFIPLGTTGGTSILATPGNTRVVDIYGGQLYGSSGSGSYTNVFTVGTGLPTTGGATAVTLPGLPTSGASPYAYAFVGSTVLYIADDSSTASGGGVQKWTLGSGTWTLTTTFNNGLAAGARGVTAITTGSSVTVLATVAVSSANTLVAFVDDGVTLNPPATVLATAAANTVYRGVALSPE